MAIERTVETDVYCDVCGEWIMGWKSNDTGVSRAWAAEYTRRRGGTVGKKIVCKKCRIKERIRTCSLQRKIGNAGRDSDGTCMGFASVVSDEPMERCKRCIACTSLINGKNSSEDRSRNGAQAPSGHDGNVIADDGKLIAVR